MAGHGILTRLGRVKERIQPLDWLIGKSWNGGGRPGA